ncbi:MAG TPA: hypothetical protein VJ343_01335, partial [archaeon]|nr:hypothetical protein [archaeon]
MAFDFLGKLLGKKDEPEPEMNLEEINSMIKRKSDGLLVNFEDDIEEKYSKITAAKIDILDRLNALQRAGVNTQTDSQLLQFVIGHRNSFANKIRSAVKNMETPKEINFETTLNFYNRSSETMDNAGSKSIPDYEEAKILFERQLLDVMEKIKVLDWLLKGLRYPIENKMGSYDDIKFSSKTLEELKEAMDSLERNRKNLEELQIEIGNLNREKEIAEENIEKLVNGDEWKKFNELKLEKNNLEDEIGKTEGEIVRILSPLERPLKKLKNLVDNGAERFEGSNRIGSYISSAREAVENDKGLVALYSILRALQDLTGKGRIEMKSRKEKRTAGLIDEILNDKMLENVLIRLGNQREERERIVDRLKSNDLDEKKSNLERELGYLKDKISQK